MLGSPSNQRAYSESSRQWLAPSRSSAKYLRQGWGVTGGSPGRRASEGWCGSEGAEGPLAQGVQHGASPPARLHAGPPCARSSAPARRRQALANEPVLWGHKRHCTLGPPIIAHHLDLLRPVGEKGLAQARQANRQGSKRARQILQRSGDCFRRRRQLAARAPERRQQAGGLRRQRMLEVKACFAKVSFSLGVQCRLKRRASQVRAGAFGWG